MKKVWPLIFICSTFLFYKCTNDSSVREKKDRNNEEVLIKRIGVHQYQVSLENSDRLDNIELHFGHYDTIARALIEEDTANIITYRSGKYFIILNDNPNTRNGYLQVKSRRNDDTYDMYAFEMTEK